jgi:predicted Zn-dependent protease
MLLELVQQPRGSVQQIAQSSMANAGWRQLAGQPLSVNGLSGYVGTYQGSMQGLGVVDTLAAHIAYNNQVYVLAGLAPANDFRGAENAFEATIRSFRPLTAAEAENIRPSRVDVYTVREGDTWASLARRAPDPAIKPSTIAIMNDHDPSQAPRPGDRVKIIVEG